MTEHDQQFPYKLFDAFGRKVPVYLLSFDENGVCKSPKSLDHLLSRLAAREGREVLLYSHGWNNDFPTAVARYDAFLTGLSSLATLGPGTLPDGFDPVFVGVIWPSTALTFGNENAPDIAGADPMADEVACLAGNVASEALALAQPGRQLGPDEAAQLAKLLIPGIADDPDGETKAVRPEDILAAASALQRAATDDPPPGGFDIYGAPSSVPAPGLPAAGGIGWFDPRMLVRVATVLQMKSRAGIVGRGLGNVVRAILAIEGPRLFLVGHSYGAKVVMSALAGTAPTRKVEAAMLLQPAISRLCFAEDINGTGPGGYRVNLARVARPIVTTFSEHDLPLRRLFHLVARRAEDLGEIQVAGASLYAALGGYGPDGQGKDECIVRGFAAPPAPYVWPADPVRIIALDGREAITGHGDIANKSVLWAMLNLLK